MTEPHTLAECPQSPIISDMRLVLNRVAGALETIAAQGVMVATLEKTVEKHDDDLKEAFHRIRKIENVHNIEAGVQLEKKRMRRMFDFILKHAPIWFPILFALGLLSEKYDWLTHIEELIK